MNVIDLEYTKHIEKIFHIADLHIRPYKRHTEYKQVFINLYQSLIEGVNDNSVIVLTGDIVHAKTELTPELVDMLSDLFLRLSAICPVILIPGNHDANLNNTNRMDALTPIVSSLNLDNFYYLKASGVYKFGDVYFVHMSIFDDELNYIKASDIPDLSPKIALYHGVVDKSTNEFGYNLRNDKINSAFFSGYDYALLGDIHKHQFLAKNVAYPGSLIQQNHGEYLTHGYILWDLENETSEFVKVENDFGYYTLEIRDSNIPDITDMPKKCRLRVQAYDIPSSDLNEIITEIKKKYGPTEITINRINSILGDDNIDNKLEIPNVGDVSYQNRLIEEYLDQNTTSTKEYIDLVKDINTHSNSKIETEDIIRNVRWSPLKFEWSNMFSYGEKNSIDFTNMKGVIGLFAPNATGKSAFVDSLSFCLFDKASRDFKPINIMNNKKDSFDCNIEFLMSDKVYSIHKHVWKNKRGGPMYKSSFSVLDDVENEQVSLNGDNRWETNKSISSRIGTFEDFVLTSFSMQNKNANFIEKGHSERKDLIIQFIGLGIFDRLYDVAAEELKEVTSVLKNLTSEDWDDKLIDSQKLQSEYKETYNKLLKDKDKLDNFIKLSNTNIAGLLEQLIDVEEDIDIDKLKDDLDELSNLDETTEQLLDEVNKLSKINDNDTTDTKQQIDIYIKLEIEKMYKDYSDLLTEQKTLSSSIDTLKMMIDNKNNKLEKLKEVEFDPNCKYCMNNALVKDAVAAQEEVKLDTKKYNDLLADLHSLDEILGAKGYVKTEYETYNMLKESLSKLEVDTHKLALIKSQRQNELTSVRDAIKRTNDQIDKYEYFKASLENNSRINTLVVDLTNDIEEQHKILKGVNDEILKEYGKIEVEKSNQTTFESNIGKLNEYSKKHDCYKLYLESIKRDGIPYNIISKVIPSIEVEINHILNQIVDFSIIINLDESKNINMYIVYDENNYWPLELSSGMERFISSIAIRVALTNISNLPRPNFLIIDEGWGSLDSDNLNSVSMLMDYLKTQFEFILLISHIDQIRDVADSLIEIKHENDFSAINHIS